ncbi:hypothetical protein AVT10_06130 [Sphingomonas hankookensis]|uniref:Uncharacterized protein n=1 Tax=Sphingomonas hankookensis TaxID=563996 RepID=A0ABR5Y8Y1_9SPHN|nr:hypothetical protein AVT10_06130 [Sphingomonas hankookensis]
MLLLPGRGAFACAQADDHVADARRLSGLQREVAGFAVALVEQADHRDALGHRRGTGEQAAVEAGIDADDFRRTGAGTDRFGNRDLRVRTGRRRLSRLPATPAEPAADRQQDRDRQPGQPAAEIHASGLHAS